MTWDEPTQEELDDAIIEDTIHCRRCKTACQVTDGYSFDDDRWICEECTQVEIAGMIAERDALRARLAALVDKTEASPGDGSSSMSQEIGDAFAELDRFFEEHRAKYNLSFGLQYSSVIDWVADITPRRGHPKARQYPLWQSSAMMPGDAIRQAIKLSMSAIADYEDETSQLQHEN